MHDIVLAAKAHRKLNRNGSNAPTTAIMMHSSLSIMLITGYLILP